VPGVVVEENSLQVQVHALRKLVAGDVIACLAAASAAQRPASCSRR